MSEFWCERSSPRPRELRIEMCQWESRNKRCLTLLEGMQFDHGFFALASNNAENTEIEEWLVRISKGKARLPLIVSRAASWSLSDPDLGYPQGS